MANSRSQDKRFWKLASKFETTTRTKPPYPPLVGETVGEWTILGAWVSEYGYLKAYKARCSCGFIKEYLDVSNVKQGTSTRCHKCQIRNANLSYREPENEIIRYFYDTYGVAKGEKLWQLYDKRREKGKAAPFPNGIPFDENWKKDYKAFAEYVSKLPNFDKWPKYQIDRIDNEKGYVEGNIRFVTVRENMRNRSNTNFLEFHGQTMPVTAFMEMALGPNYDSAPYVSQFIMYRVAKYGGELTFDNVLKMLYENETIWPNEEVKDYYRKWFREEFNNA